jgi:hypothetical protein
MWEEKRFTNDLSVEDFNYKSLDNFMFFFFFFSYVRNKFLICCEIHLMLIDVIDSIFDVEVDE